MVWMATARPTLFIFLIANIPSTPPPHDTLKAARPSLLGLSADSSLQWIVGRPSESPILGGGGGKTKEISMRIGVKVLITKQYDLGGRVKWDNLWNQKKPKINSVGWTTKQTKPRPVASVVPHLIKMGKCMKQKSYGWGPLWESGLWYIPCIYLFP